MDIKKILENRPLHEAYQNARVWLKSLDEEAYKKMVCNGSLERTGAMCPIENETRLKRKEPLVVYVHRGGFNMVIECIRWQKVGFCKIYNRVENEKDEIEF